MSTARLNWLQGPGKAGHKASAGNSAGKAKEIAKIIKDSKMKVQAEIQKDQLRVRAKKIDDLQLVMTMLKGKDFRIHMEFVNYR